MHFVGAGELSVLGESVNKLRIFSCGVTAFDMSLLKTTVLRLQLKLYW